MFKKIEDVLNFICDSIVYAVIVFVLMSMCRCSSTPDRLPPKLDLSSEKEIIIQDKTLNDNQKNFIIRTFEKSEKICQDNVTMINDLYKVIDKQKEQIKTLDEQAKIYRFVRNILLSILVGFILYQLRGIIMPIVKRFIGLP